MRAFFIATVPVIQCYFLNCAEVHRGCKIKIMLHLRAFIFMLLSCLLSLNVAMASERAPISVQVLTTEQMHESHATHHANSQTADNLDCKNHCASQSMASNHCGVCLSGLATSMPLMLVSLAPAILVSAPTVVLQSIHFPPPLHPPLQIL